MANENLGPAERIINTVLAYSDHMVHNRPGMVAPDPTSVTGVKWTYTKYKPENGVKVAYRQDKGPVKRIRGKLVPTTIPVRIGTVDENNVIHSDTGVRLGIYRTAGLFTEVAVWIYRQIVEVYKLDDTFLAKWASYAFMQEHKDLKVALAAFMLVQPRKGDPVVGDNGKAEFYDLDYRDVGEAMMLLNVKTPPTTLKPEGEEIHLDAKHLLRIFDFLQLPEIAQINRELGFTASARKAPRGRWDRAVKKWLNFREQNPKLLKGLIKSGQRTAVMQLAEFSGYKPTTPAFFSFLRWKQNQADDGRRQLAIGEAVSAAASWNDLTEEQICQKISSEKPNYKVIGTLVPQKIGITPAIMAAAIQAGCLSDKDLILATPTIEDLGLMKHPDTKAKWESAMKKQNDMRAANIAKRVQSKEVKESLQTAAETALKEQVAEVVRGLRVYFMVDKSGSMEGAIEAAKDAIKKCLPAFPLDQLHVSVFSTEGREVEIRFASAAGVENAFKGVNAGGGTDYGEGVRVLSHHKPKPGEDALFIFVGDEGNERPHFVEAVRNSGLNPVAFGLIPITSPRYGRSDKVRRTAQMLEIPCFEIDERVFADPYAIPRTMRNLIASTPVGQGIAPVAAAPKRVSLVETILKTEILKKPVWAEPDAGAAENAAA
jgi:hypothetical protein